MLFRNALMTAGGIAALAIPVLAGGPNLYSAPATKIDPVQYRGYTLINGRMVFTTDWIPYGQANSRSNFTAAFDQIELDLTGGVLGAPTDGLPGCTWDLDVGFRWYFGPDYNNPFVSSDMTTDTAGAGQMCQGLGFIWFMNVGANTGTSDLFVAVQTFEDMRFPCVDPSDPFYGDTQDDGSEANFLGGVLLQYAPIGGSAGHYSTPDLTDFPIPMPADGQGGFQIIFATGQDPDTGALIVPTGIDPNTLEGVNIQPMLWGTGEHEVDAALNPQPDGRPGTSGLEQYDDDAPANGVHDVDGGFALECYLYTQFAADCPSVTGAAVGFYYKGGENPCPCMGDLDGDGDRDISDLAVFLSQFGSTGAPGSLGCADTDADGDVDISDLAQVLSVFGIGC